jgi:hypothetical protein|tara:strand:+ start:192 stop:683 length:492 start_codon:yes stop_codon:yes gene_type:complete
MHESAVWVHPTTGNVCVTTFAFDDAERPSRLTDREFITASMQLIADREKFDEVPNYRLTPEGEASEHDQYFRDAWIDVNFNVDIEKARAIHIKNIRTVRNAELAKLDVPMMQAMESSDQVAISKIAKQKGQLRDIPETFDMVTGISTADQLRRKWPEGLPKQT